MFSEFCPEHWGKMKHKAVQNFWKYVGINLKSESDKQIQGPRTAFIPLPGIKDARVTDSTTLRDVEKKK